MAPSYNYGITSERYVPYIFNPKSSSNKTSHRRHNVLIPDKLASTIPYFLSTIAYIFRFQCCLCNIWKSNQLFSKKEINGYRDAKVNRKPAAEMKCSTCKGGPINERKCLSCYVVKFNEEFSKSARAHGGSGVRIHSSPSFYYIRINYP